MAPVGALWRERPDDVPRRRERERSQRQHRGDAGRLAPDGRRAGRIRPPRDDTERRRRGHEQNHRGADARLGEGNSQRGDGRDEDRERSECRRRKHCYEKSRPCERDREEGEQHGAARREQQYRCAGVRPPQREAEDEIDDEERDRRDRGTVPPDQGEPHRGHGCSRSTSSRTSQPHPGPPGTTSSPSRDLGHGGRQLLAPGDVVDVDLEQPHVRDRGAPLGGDERREVAVVVVRRAGDLVRLGERGDLQRLREPVPDHVDGGDVHRARLEVRPEAAQRVEVLARAERDRRAAPRVGERRRVVRVDLEPREVVRLERPGDPDDPLGREVEVEVDDRLRLAARPLAERLEQPRQRLEQLGRRVAVDAAVAPEAGHQHPRLVARDDDVRLEGAVAALDDLAAERGDGVVGVELRRAGHLPGARARRAAVRPVERDRLPRRAAEELGDRDAERLALEVEERVLDPADRLLHDRARALARPAVEVPVDRLDRARVAADDERRQVGDDAGEPGGRAVRVGHLRPADEPVVRRRLDEEPRPPAGVAGERLERGELHGAPGYGSRATGTSRARPSATSCSARAKSSSSSMFRPS